MNLKCVGKDATILETSNVKRCSAFNSYNSNRIDLDSISKKIEEIKAVAPTINNILSREDNDACKSNLELSSKNSIDRSPSLLIVDWLVTWSCNWVDKGTSIESNYSKNIE